MRVAIFTNNYLPTLGGVPHSIETLRIGLERSGHLAYVFAPRVPGFSDSSPHVFRVPSFLALQAMVQRKAIQWSTRFSNRSDLIIAPSPGTLKVLRQQGVTGRIEVIPSGVDLTRFAPGDKRSERSASSCICRCESVCLHTPRASHGSF